MSVLFVTSEFADFAKAGGLADVAASLPRALRQRGLDVRVMMPAFPEVLQAGIPITFLAALPALAGLEPCLIGQMQLPCGLIVHPVLSPSLYQRPGTPYLTPDGQDWPDNDLRFARLGLAAAEMARGLPGVEWRPRLVHAHDWPAAMACAYLNWMGSPARSLLTIHNLAHQGLFPAERRRLLGIPERAFGIDGVEFHGQVGFLKAGLFYADHVTTVSPTYAREITTAPFGAGLDGLTRGLAAEGRLSGIINGLDEGWNPANDHYLLETFDASRLAVKRRIAERLRVSLCLRASEGPLFGMTSRLVHQKGIDLVAECAERIIARGGQIAMLGVGEPQVEAMLLRLMRRHRGSLALMSGYNEPMARRVLAASDFYLMPSRFEPCGLTQMQAQRYAALPIAHATGGLADTITDEVTGFLFSPFGAQSFMAAIERAFAVWRDPERLEAMRRQAMARRFDWAAPAAAYEALYADLAGIEPDRRARRAAPVARLRAVNGA